MLQGFKNINLKTTTLFVIMIVGILGSVAIQTSLLLNTTTGNQTTVKSSNSPVKVIIYQKGTVQTNIGNQMASNTISQKNSDNSLSTTSTTKQFTQKDFSKNQNTNNNQNSNAAQKKSNTKSLSTMTIAKVNGINSITGTLGVTLTASPGSGGVDVGQTVIFTASAGGGTAPYTYTYSGLPTGCTDTSGGASSLSCKPTASGTYGSVTVNAFDSTGLNFGTKSISYTVEGDPTISTPSPSKSSGGIDVGQQVTFSVTAGSGSGGYSYSWAGLPTGCGSGNTASLACTPTGAGTFSIKATVKDSNGVSTTSAALGYTVIADPTISTPSPSKSSGGIDIGQQVTFSVTASSGSGGYTYSWAGLPTGCSTGNTASLACTPSGAGTFSIKATVKDSNGVSTISAALGYTVIADPTISTPSPSITSGGIDIGQQVTFSVTAGSGSGGYTYSWVGLPSGCNTADTASLACTPTASGTFSIKATVTDSNGFSVVSSTISYTVLNDPSVSIPSANITSGNLDVGQSVTFSVTASGGTGSGTYAYLWAGLPTGCTSVNSNTISCNPTASGTYGISVKVTDSNNFATTSSILTYTVLSDPTVSVPTANISSGGIDAGQSVTFTSATPVGGLSPYTYSWSGLPIGCTDSGLSTVVCSNSGQGTYNVVISVTDSNGFTVTSSSLSYKVLPDPAISSFTGNTTNIDLNQGALFTVTPNSGTGTYSYTWYLDNTGCTGTSNSNTANCVPSSTGSFTINVTVTDSNGFSVTSNNIVLTVNSDPTVGAISYSIPSGGIDAGQHVTFTSAVPTGGYGSYQYSWNSLPTGCTGLGTNTVSCTPASGGTFSITVTITDSNGYSVQSPALVYVVNSALSISTPSANVSSIDLGQSVNFSITVSGGTGTYSIAYSGLPVGCSSNNVNSISCVPSSSGSYTITASVSDSNHATDTSGSLSFTVYSDPVASSPTLSTSTITVGSSATFTTTVTGGSGNFVYSWSPSSANLNCATSTTNSITCTPTATGSYTITVTATDSNGGTTTATSSTLTVNAAPSSSTTISTTTHPTSSTQPTSKTTPTSNTKPSKHSPGFTTLVVMLGIIFSAGVVTFNRRHRKH